MPYWPLALRPRCTHRECVMHVSGDEGGFADAVKAEDDDFEIRRRRIHFNHWLMKKLLRREPDDRW